MVIQTGGIVKRRSKSERRNCNNNNNININEESAINNNLSFQSTETLPLFPTHPTGDLQAGLASPSQPMAPGSASSGNSADDSAGGRRPYFEFFM